MNLTTGDARERRRRRDEKSYYADDCWVGDAMNGPCSDRLAGRRQLPDRVFYSLFRSCNLLKMVSGGTSMAEDSKRSSFNRRAVQDRRRGADVRSEEEQRSQGERRSSSDRRSGLDRRLSAADKASLKIIDLTKIG